MGGGTPRGKGPLRYLLPPLALIPPTRVSLSGRASLCPGVWTGCCLGQGCATDPILTSFLPRCFLWQWKAPLGFLGHSHLTPVVLCLSEACGWPSFHPHEAQMLALSPPQQVRPSGTLGAFCSVTGGLRPLPTRPAPRASWGGRQPWHRLLGTSLVCGAARRR